MNRPGLVDPLRNAIDNRLHGDISQREVLAAQHETGKEIQVDGRGHVGEWIERYGIPSTQKTGIAHAAALSHHLQGILERGVADDIHHSIDTVGIKAAHFLAEFGLVDQASLATQ